MFEGSRFGILDFDRLCQAEPALDLGRFLAPLRVTLGKRGSTDAGELAARFIDRYAASGGVPTDPLRIAVYECTALVRMAARSWLQLKTSRLRTVLRIIEERIAELDLEP
jgi:aminoglycoside phosphotransferase (APT) family kinase protein